MLLRSLFICTLIISLFIHTLNAINPTYLQEHNRNQLADISSSDIDNEPTTLSIKQDDNDEDDLVKRNNRYPKFYFSPLWLSRRTRTNRFYGKPLWISRPGR